MCGICGIVNFSDAPVNSRDIKDMMNLLKHRGPDDEGSYLYKNLGLGHLRLSIIDLTSAGHQPMFSEDKRFCIIYNGEVYNYIELREQLSSEFLIFHTPWLSKTTKPGVLSHYPPPAAAA